MAPPPASPAKVLRGDLAPVALTPNLSKSCTALTPRRDERALGAESSWVSAPIARMHHSVPATPTSQTPVLLGGRVPALPGTPLATDCREPPRSALTIHYEQRLLALVGRQDGLEQSLADISGRLNGVVEEQTEQVARLNDLSNVRSWAQGRFDELDELQRSMALDLKVMTAVADRSARSQREQQLGFDRKRPVSTAKALVDLRRDVGVLDQAFSALRKDVSAYFTAEVAPRNCLKCASSCEAEGSIPLHKLLHEWHAASRRRVTPDRMPRVDNSGRDAPKARFQQFPERPQHDSQRRPCPRASISQKYMFTYGNGQVAVKATLICCLARPLVARAPSEDLASAGAAALTWGLRHELRRQRHA